MSQPVKLETGFELKQFIRPNDLIAWSQAAAEPHTLVSALMEQRHSLGGVRAFLGVTTAPTIQPEHGDCIQFLSYGGVGRNSSLYFAGVMDIIPCHYSQLSSIISHDSLRPDVVFLQLSPKEPNGKHSVGIVNDYSLHAAKSARVVIAEINQQMPWVYGSELPEGLRIDAYIETDVPLHQIPSAKATEIDQKIAALVAPLIPDGATLEMGIGSLPDTIISSLKGHKNLGVHSGMLGDSILELIELGVVNNSLKTIDNGVTVAGVLMGTDRLYDFARENPQLKLYSSEYTHNALVLAKIDNFYAVNSAIEVDITGQINAEMVGQRYLGAVGGQADFMKGAQLSKGGRAIIAIPSAIKDGQISRIVASIPTTTVTTTRSDADLFVTEYGVADLKGQPLKERIKRMIAIAHPAHREALEAQALPLVKA